MKLLPERQIKALIGKFYHRKDQKKEPAGPLLRELLQTVYSQGYAQGVKDGRDQADSEPPLHRGLNDCAGRAGTGETRIKNTG